MNLAVSQELARCSLLASVWREEFAARAAR